MVDLKSVGDLKSLLVSDRKHETIEGFHDDLLGRKANEARAKIKNLPLGNDADIFTPTVERIKGLETQVADLKGMGADTSGLEKVVAAQKTELGKTVGSHYKTRGTIIEHHVSSLEHIAAERAQHEKQLADAYAKEVSTISKTATTSEAAEAAKVKLENLKHNHDLTREKLGEHFDAVTEHHKTRIGEIQEAVGQTEKATGIKASEHMSEKALAGAKTAAGKGDGIISRFTNNFAAKEKGGKGKLMMIGGTVAIGALAIDGLRRVGKAIGILSPSKDENGVDQPAGVGIGVVELAAAGGLGFLLAKAPKGAGATR